MITLLTLKYKIPDQSKKRGVLLGGQFTKKTVLKEENVLAKVHEKLRESTLSFFPSMCGIVACMQNTQGENSNKNVLVFTITTSFGLFSSICVY